jgi:hypothetical protein
MEKVIDFVSLINNNPISNVSNTIQNNFLNKIKENLTEEDQKIFTAILYCYLTYNQTNDFLIDLDSIWKWIGFCQKNNAVRIIKKQFKEGVDYIYSSHKTCNNSNKRGGHNITKIILSFNAFKILYSNIFNLYYYRTTHSNIFCF